MQDSGGLDRDAFAGAHVAEHKNSTMRALKNTMAKLGRHTLGLPATVPAGALVAGPVGAPAPAPAPVAVPAAVPAAAPAVTGPIAAAAVPAAAPAVAPVVALAHWPLWFHNPAYIGDPLVPLPIPAGTSRLVLRGHRNHGRKWYYAFWSDEPGVSRSLGPTYRHSDDDITIDVVLWVLGPGETAPPQDDADGTRRFIVNLVRVAGGWHKIHYTTPVDRAFSRSICWTLGKSSGLSFIYLLHSLMHTLGIDA